MKANARKLSTKRATMLIEQMAHTRDAEMSKALMCDVYLLADGGGLLVFEDGRGLLYKSYHELLARYQQSSEAAQSFSNPLRDLLAAGPDFVSSVPKLIQNLPAALRIDTSALDLSERSLEAIDKAIKKVGSESVLTAQIFAPLTAYVGEVIRRSVGGRWDMRLDDDGVTWVPWIVDGSGRSYSPVRIYKELIEHGRSASIQTFVRGTVEAQFLSHPKSTTN